MRQLIESIRAVVKDAGHDGALAREAVARLEDALRAALPRLQRAPVCRTPPKPGRYLCYKDPEYGFVVMLMAWGRGDGTPIHDHGCWGVEAVLTESLVVTQYTECEVSPQPLGRRDCRAGDVMHNLPPDRDVHTVRNEAADIALSLHVYGREMSGNRQFVPGEGFKACGLKTCELDLGVWELAGEAPASTRFARAAEQAR